jgi:uncharacterized protein
MQPSPSPSATVSVPKSVAPVLPNERIAVLDALRGFALFGVLIANTQHFAGTTGAPPVSDALHWPRLDSAARFMVDAAVDGKFYSLFALLFGLGCALQWQRGVPARTAQRRMLVLLGLGLLHLCLLWYGDILSLYALLGLLLLASRGWPSRRLWRVSLVLLALPVLLHAVFLLVLPARSAGADPAALRFATERAVADGSYAARVSWNVAHGIGQRAFDLVGTGRPFKVFAMFLLGVLACRLRLWRKTHSRLVLRVLVVGLLVGVPLNWGLALMMQTSAYERLQPLGILQPAVYAYGVPALALAYASAFVLSFRSPGFARLASATLGKVGRLSLSNYLLQSLLGVLIYSGFAGALFGRLGTTASLLLASAVFVLQIALSSVWLRYFDQGPVERLWRALSYGRSQKPANYADRLGRWAHR